MGKIEFDHTGSGGGITLSTDGTDLLVGGSAVGGGGDLITSTSFPTTGFTLTNADKGKYYHMTGSNQTITLPASSAISAGWYVFASLDKNAVYRLNINAAAGDYWYNGETSSYSIYAGNTVLVIYRGSGEWGLIGNDYYMATSAYGSSNRPGANGARSMAIGAGASASGNYRYAFGKDATATGNLYATAMTRSYASGASSFAAAIDSNSSSYGSQGTHTISIGCLAKSIGTQALSIGAGADASGNNSVSIGTGSQSCQQGGTAVGWNARNYTNDAVAIGRNACSFGYSAIAIGESYAGGNDSIAIGIKCCANTFGTNTACAMSIGVRSKAQGTFAQAIGFCAIASTASSLSLGYCAISETGTQAMAIGFCACATSVETTSVGPNTKTNSFYSTALGSQAIAGTSATVGQRSVAIGKSYTAGNDSFAAVIGNNTTSYGATNCEGIAMGWQAKAGGIGAIAIGGCNLVTNTRGTAIGCGSTVSGSTGLALGADHCVSGTYAAALGGYCTCSAGTYTTTFGPFACASVENSFAYGAKAFFENGGAQGGMYLLWADTTDATSEILNSSGGTAGATNQVVASTDTAVTFDGTITAIKQGGAEYGSWKIEGLLVNDGGTTTLPNSIITTIHNNFGWNLAVGPDNTNNALNITVTGAASTNIRWLANIRTTEITYA